MRFATAAPALAVHAAWRIHGAGRLAVTALAGVSLEVWPGELVAVMGPSGSGKSTLLNLAGGLDQPTRGDVRIMGTSTVGRRPAALAQLRRRHLGLVFQELNLVGSLTALENVALPRELDGVPVRTARREAGEALEAVGLGHRADRFPARLSGGEQQRVAIARALVGGRRLVLADEPTGALDTSTGDEVLRLIRERCDTGAAALVVTHNPRHAAWADRVVFLRDGREATRSDYGAEPFGAARPADRAAPADGRGLSAPTAGGTLGAPGVEGPARGSGELPLAGLAAALEAPR
ncbi:MAG: ABC transporter ATP-binding protein [Candidatus Nanopelagicales bacterium]|jgi:putative ABC transport system ATP-binding protein|nr:ABC transporter ATP-binding protein [Candidatus Nanopelagicales bacterium]